MKKIGEGSGKKSPEAAVPALEPENFIENCGKQILAALRGGKAPLPVAIELLPSEFSRRALKDETLNSLESAIEGCAGRDGWKRRRRQTVNLGGQPFEAWTYYLPSEKRLFKAIDGKHPVVLAVTPEQHRFAREVIEQYGEGEQNRPIFLWTSSSGLFEIEGKGKGKVFHPICNPRRIAEGIAIDIRPASEVLDGAVPQNNSARMGKAPFRGGQIPYLAVLNAESNRLAVILGEEESTGEQSSSDNEADERTIQFFRGVAESIIAGRNGSVAEAIQRGGLDAVISHLLANPVQGAMVICMDVHRYLDRGLAAMQAAGTAGGIKDLYYRLRRKDNGMQFALFAADADFPTELREQLLRVDLPLPSRAELEMELRQLISEKHFSDTLESDLYGHLTRLVDSACGMTIGETRAVIRQIPTSGETSAAEVVSAMHEAKKQSISRTPALEVVDLLGMEPKIDGMDRLVAWLGKRQQVFERPEAARAAGIDRRPKGVLLLGIPGTGKSLAAKVVANDWKLPLLRLDLGAIQDKYYGSSEARMREALKTVATISPCVLWIDEIDKGIAQGEGMHSNSADLNIRATLLTWMQEYREPIFIVATANRINLLPPELLRAGRFDATFFLGCPADEGRRKILELHLKRRDINLLSSDINKIVKTTMGFTGAELEQLVLDALYDAFNEENSPRPTVAHFEERLRGMKPLIKTIGLKDENEQKTSLDEVWDLIDQGRVEPASDHLLTRTEVASIIDPLLYRPVYCRLESISGFQRLQTKAERLSMGVLHGGATATVLDAGGGWVFGYTSVRYDVTDEHNFKFLDRLTTLAENDVLDSLVVQFGLEQIIFVEPELRKQFEDNSRLANYAELFVNAAA